MGLRLCKSFCCSCCCCCKQKTNSVGVLPERHLKVLLLGLAGSGKTEIGHKLSHKQRVDYESTNGVQYYQMQLPERVLSITEVGGNVEMQKIWHHYFVTAMGIIYCFDMSASFAELQLAFECLQRTLMHPFVRGKPVLLVATKSDLVDEGVQLYDIENAFQLEALARYYACSVHLCCAGAGAESNVNSLLLGVGWLVRYIVDNLDMLKMRIRCDSNMKTWQQQINKLIAEGRIRRSRYQRFQGHLKLSKRRKLWYRSMGNFRHRRIRPHTAPAVINATASKSHEVTVECKISTMPNEEFTLVPNTNEDSGLTIAQLGKCTQV